MPIPGVPGAEQVQSPQGRPKLNVSALTAPMRGRAAIAQGIEQVGDVMGQMALKMQEARNTRAIAEADLLMRQKTDEFMDSLAKQPDHSKWVSNFREQVPGVQQAVFQKNPDMAPVVRRKLELGFKDWEQRTSANVQTMATRAEVKDTRMAVDLASDMAARQGDEMGAMAPYQSEGAKHVFTKEEIQASIDAAGQKVDHAKAIHGVNENPKATLEDLQDKTPEGRYRQFKRLSEEQRYSLLGEARRRMYQEQGDTAEGLSERFNTAIMDAQETGKAADLGAMVEQVNQAEKAGKLNARGATALRNSLKREKLEERKALAGDLMMQAADYDHAQDKDGKHFNDIRSQASGLPVAEQKRVLSILNAPDKATLKEVFQVIDSGFNKGFYGAKPWYTRYQRKAAEGGGWSTKIDREEWFRQQQNRVALQTEMQHWYGENPRSGFGEAMKHLRQQMAPYQRKGMISILADAVSSQFGLLEEVQEPGEVIANANAERD